MNTVYLDDITGTIGEWLDSDMSEIPTEAIRKLSEAYAICANALEE